MFKKWSDSVRLFQICIRRVQNVPDPRIHNTRCHKSKLDPGSLVLVDYLLNKQWPKSPC
jgi:hypothetical protein